MISCILFICFLWPEITLKIVLTSGILLFGNPKEYFFASQRRQMQNVRKKLGFIWLASNRLNNDKLIKLKWNSYTKVFGQFFAQHLIKAESFAQFVGSVPDLLIWILSPVELETEWHTALHKSETNGRWFYNSGRRKWRESFFLTFWKICLIINKNVMIFLKKTFALMES